MEGKTTHTCKALQVCLDIIVEVWKNREKNHFTQEIWERFRQEMCKYMFVEPNEDTQDLRWTFSLRVPRILSNQIHDKSGTPKLLQP
jgi:hypothetical protein